MFEIDVAIKERGREREKARDRQTVRQTRMNKNMMNQRKEIHAKNCGERTMEHKEREREKERDE